MAEYVFCVDSDGCVMDTMTYKHEKFFGPIAADKFGVEDKETFQKNWEDINLYTKTRGVNRFTGLVMGLQSVGVEGIDNLVKWEADSSSLSNTSLEEEIEKVGSEDLKKALEWSEEVNKGISEAEGLDKPFEGAKEGLAALQAQGKVYVVSSANEEAIDEEWGRHELLQYVDDVYAQNKGKKADVIKMLISQGNDPENILMVGDSPGDLDAAEKNDALFYPILVGKEKASWDTLINEELANVTAGKYAGPRESKQKQAFWDNLDNN